MPTAPKNAKKPADRKPKAVESVDLIGDISQLPGYDLLKPMDEIPAWDQTPLIAQLQVVYEDQEKETRKLRLERVAEMRAQGVDVTDIDLESIEVETSFDVNIIGQLIKSLIPFAKDEAAFTKFASGAGAIERAGELAMAWVGQMGESASSEAS